MKFNCSRQLFINRRPYHQQELNVAGSQVLTSKNVFQHIIAQYSLQKNSNDSWKRKVSTVRPLSIPRSTNNFLLRRLPRCRIRGLGVRKTTCDRLFKHFLCFRTTNLALSVWLGWLGWSCSHYLVFIMFLEITKMASVSSVSKNKG